MRDAVIAELYEMAEKLTKRYNYEMWRKMWEICLDWNSEHEDEEIFMCEDEDEDGKFRYYIEDDYFYLADC